MVIGMQVTNNTEYTLVRSVVPHSSTFHTLLHDARLADTCTSFRGYLTLTCSAAVVQDTAL